jgi:hypothetical protein
LQFSGAPEGENASRRGTRCAWLIDDQPALSLEAAPSGAAEFRSGGYE